MYSTLRPDERIAREHPAAADSRPNGGARRPERSTGRRRVASSRRRARRRRRATQPSPPSSAIRPRPTACVCASTTVHPPEFVGARVAPAGSTCVGKPCWKVLNNEKGFVYKDKLRTPTGVEVRNLKAGDVRKPQVQVKGKGVEVTLPSLPLTDRCWCSSLPMAAPAPRWSTRRATSRRTRRPSSTRRAARPYLGARFALPEPSGHAPIAFGVALSTMHHRTVERVE